LRVLLASWAPFHAGAEVAAERLATGLVEAGHRVTVALGTEGETLRRMQSEGLDVRYVPLAFTDKYHWWRYRRAQRELLRVISDVRPDVVHANDLPTSQMVGQAAGKLRIPRICHHRWLFGGAAIDWLNKFGAERHVFVSHPFMDEMCRSSARLQSVPRVVVHDCVPLPRVPSDTDRFDARRRLGLPLDAPIVLFAGQISERKGIEDLIRAWQRVTSSRSTTATLLFVGEDLENSGDYRRRMECLSAELGAPAHFVGFQRDVFAWIIAADICVVPSHAEPFGLAVAEAMAHARPVIGAKVGGIPEMIVDGETGLLVPPRDPAKLAEALERLLQDARLRAEFGQAGRRRCEERFSIDRHVVAIVEQYRQVMSQHAAVSA
jgi:glycosyltransferase involved in cell wall biosynthesis